MCFPDVKKHIEKSDDLEELYRYSDEVARIYNRINERIRIKEAQNRSLPDLHNYSKSTKLSVNILEEAPAWSPVELSDCVIPSMISKEEARYYMYLGQFYRGDGEIVELGPWLGSSTYFIHQGLSDCPYFKNRKIHVYDDFVWRSSFMNDKVRDDERLSDGADFKGLFDKYVASFKENLIVYKRRISSDRFNFHVPILEWKEKQIEMLFVDCGRTFKVNETWYDLLAPFFIPGKTLIIMQDWHTHQEVPVRWYNQIKQFTDAHKGELTLMHELRHGGVATFLYGK